MGKLQDIDQEIATLERLLANANERRREEVNRTDANKKPYCRRNLNGSDSHYCPECEKGVYKKPL